jgi:site-specific DNA recombinase
LRPSYETTFDRVPLGYTVEEIEKRGHRKKAFNAVEAETVRLIFKFCLEGDERSGPLGIKEMVKTLNARGVRTAWRAFWGRTSAQDPDQPDLFYIGEWRFNRRHAKAGREKPATEVIGVGVPPIIERQTFDKVQRTLKARHPHSTPPGVTTGRAADRARSLCQLRQRCARGQWGSQVGASVNRPPSAKPMP